MTGNKVLLYPLGHLEGSFMLEMQQWIWYRHANDFYDGEMARFLVSRPWTDPRAFIEYRRMMYGPGGSWDHPEQVWATFAPDLFLQWCRKYISYDELYELGYNRVPKEAPWGITVSRMARWEDDIKFDWIHDCYHPWGRSKKARDFGDGKDHDGPTSPKQRFTILRRDEFKCQLCGASSTDGAKLEVDHAWPRWKGGRTVPWNLWTLCRDCNYGKLGDI